MAEPQDPFSEPAAPGRTDAATPRGDETPAPVLILIDDDPDFRSLLREAVEDLWSGEGADACAHPDQRPLRICEAGNGVEGMEQLHQVTDDVAPDRVLLCIDADMPVMNGLSTLQTIAEAPELADLHRIMLSGSPDPGMQITARRIGAEAFFQKPFAGEDLLRLVAEQLLPRLRALLGPLPLPPSPPEAANGRTRATCRPAGWQPSSSDRTSRTERELSGTAQDSAPKAATSNLPADAGTNPGLDPEDRKMCRSSNHEPPARSIDPNAAAGADPADSSARGSTHETRHDGVRLMVVEDDADQQMLIRETLEDHFGPGSVDTTATCREALAAPLHDYHLILCDYNLPDGNGLDLLASLRQRCETPVMILTGENASDVAREAIGRGATDYVVKAGAYLTTMPLTVEKNIAAGRLQSERETATQTLRQRASELEENLREIEQLASTDPLTGCYNRRAFERVFEQLFAEAERTDAGLSCVMVDLDEFKEVNDSLGHQVGDDLLQAAARCIRANLRQMDVVCRYGGDEFVLLLPKTHRSQAAAVADRIRRDFSTASLSLLKTSARTMSIGIATLGDVSPRPASAGALLATADRVLYDAKQSGRNQTCSAA